MRSIAFIVLAMLCIPSFAEMPDGTLVFSNKPRSIVGRIAERMATRAQGYRAKHTHVGVVIDGRVYHADYPQVASKPIGSTKHGEIVTYVPPSQSYTTSQVDAMRSYAQSQIGKPYRLRGFIRRDGSEGWCSTFVGQVLNRGGHRVTKGQRFTPDNLMRAVK